MSKYKILETWGLRELLDKNPDWYSPDGYRMIVINNGLLGGQLLYDHTKKKVYGLTLKESPNMPVPVEKITNIAIALSEARSES